MNSRIHDDVRLYVNGDFAGTAKDVQIDQEYYMDPIDYKHWGMDSTSNAITPMPQPKQSFTIRMSSNDVITTRNAWITAKSDWYWDATNTFTGNTTTKNIPQSALNPNKQFVQPPAGFNKYVNASDLLEEFIGFLGEQNVRQSEVMDIPVEAFIKWLVIRACEEDGEEPNTTLELPTPKPQPRCLGCQRFMRRGTEFPLHGRRCAAHLFSRTEGNQHVQTKTARITKARQPALL